MAMISVDHLTFKYENAKQPTLRDTSFTLDSGHFVLLTGPSGTGKSTILKLIAGLYPQFAGKMTHGSISIDGHDLATIPETQRSQDVAMMFQNPSTQFAMDTVVNEMVFALENRQVPATEMMAKIDRALAFVEITDLKDRNINHLSGGERQKVALAVIVAMNSSVILLDEPFASVDPDARDLLMQKLIILQTKFHKTIIVADHDLNLYEQIVDNVLVVNPETRTIGELDTSSKHALFAAFQKSIPSNQLVNLPDTSSEPLVDLQHLHLSQGKRELLTTDDFAFYPGKVTLITGQNGIGKSTLFSAIVKLMKYQGRITYRNADIQTIKRREYAKQVGLVFQDAETQFLAITVAEELEISRQYRQNTFFTDEKIDECLVRLNLDHRDAQVVYSLSEGQKKKLQILTMLIVGSPVLLMDEPLRGLDLKSINTMLSIINESASALNQSVILISHQLTSLAGLINYHVQFANQQLTYVGQLS